MPTDQTTEKPELTVVPDWDEVLDELRNTNAQKVEEIERTAPGVIGAAALQILKFRLDVVTDAVFDIFEQNGAEDARKALEIRWEEVYGAFLADFLQQARKAALAAQPQGGGLVVPK